MPNLNGFNAADVEPSVGYEPIPAGDYLVAITDSEMKPTKSGVGQYLQFTLQVLEGEFKGRLLWARLNLDNPKAEAVRIARAELSAVCRAVGVLAPKDSIELHDIPMVVSVGHKKRSDGDGMDNVIRAYSKKEARAPKAAVNPSISARAPWQR